MKTDIKQIIYQALDNAKCIIDEDEESGIVTVYAQDGIWDFTIPMVNEDKEEELKVKSTKNAPIACWGSLEKVQAWQEAGGLNGLLAGEAGYGDEEGDQQ